MSRQGPRKLGTEFWFSLVMILPSLYFAYLGFEMENARYLVGALFAVAIFFFRVVRSVQKVRLARLLDRNPDIRRIYESTDR